ncbi:hypothetical protein KUH03_30955 [Sphingobacterium sp. E70]|uniref:hypothetical protein n=1 Tax=Sphingobacterium sp. E70 TaxID=2853439 RepID=UPI00211CA539|nr:hypothetical protein [Sphingobacterium sp. E70]ULT23556.1 hypothetical protein KUH03_30955 [Sphingobacterium sp. E70]
MNALAGCPTYEQGKQYPIEFKRKLDDKEYRLQIGSSRWVWPIPPPEIINNNLEQNKRY